MVKWVMAVGLKCALVAAFAAAAACARADFPNGCLPALDLGPKFPGATGSVQTVNGELRIAYDFSGGGHYVAARFGSIPDRPVVRELSFLSDCPSGVHLMLQLVDATGQTFQKWFPGNTDGYEHFTCRLERFSGHWGGAADGVFHQPLAGLAVLAHADEPDGCAKPRGTLRFRLLGLYPEETNVRFAQRRPAASLDELVRETGGLRDELARALAELEPQGRGAKTRATLAVLDDFLPWIREDVARGYTNRAVRAVWELVDVAREESARLRRVRTGEEWDPPAPHFVTGPVETSHAQTIGTREWPDGRRERGNVMLTGFGHFGRVRRELAKLPPLGNHILQMEIGPRMVLPREGTVNTNALDVFFETAARAARENVQICLLMSPHYFPDWALAKWPHLKDCSSDGFFKYCVYDAHARAIVERTLRTVIPLVRGNPALHSICLSNEPECGVFGRCPMVVREWPKHLSRRFGTVEAMNAALGTSLAAFEDAPVPAEHPKTPATPLAAEFIRFNRQAFADFHRWMAGIVRELAPELPVHAKIMVGSSFGDTVTYQSVDLEAFSETSDYSGNDAYDCPLAGDPFGWAHSWWEMEAGYDYQRSVRDIPVFNSENHVIRDRNVPTRGGRHIYTTLWQNAVHGQSATTAWQWERAFDDGTSDANGLFLDRPAWLAAWARCAIDLNRLADTLAPIQNLQPTVLLHFSLTTQLREGRRGKRFLKWYRAANFLGQPLGVATEKALADYGRGGPRARPLDSCRALLLPDDRFLPAEVKRGVDRLAADGVRVVRSEEDREERDLAVFFEKSAKEWQLPDFPRAVDPVAGTGVFGVESRGCRQDGRSYVTLVNHQDGARRVRLEAPGVDLITGRRFPEVFDLDPLVPLLIEMPIAERSER